MENILVTFKDELFSGAVILHEGDFEIFKKHLKSLDHKIEITSPWYGIYEYENGSDLLFNYCKVTKLSESQAEFLLETLPHVFEDDLFYHVAMGIKRGL